MTRAFKCDSCGDLFEGESPAVARLDVRAGDDFAVPDDLRDDQNRSVGDRVRELAGEDTGQSLLMELCLDCARDLIPTPDPAASESASGSEETDASVTGDDDTTPADDGDSE